MIKVIYKHELEEDRTAKIEFKDIAELKKHIQTETCEFEGDESIEPEDRIVIKDGDTYFDKAFGKYHSWTIIEHEETK